MRPRAPRRRLTAPGAGFLALLAAAGSALAARPPDWARAVVETAPPEPEGEGPYAERILYLETSEQVRKDGTVAVRYRYATQALRGGSERLQIGWFHFDESTTQLTSHRAWHIPPGKGAKRSRQAPVDVIVGSDFLTNSKARAVPVKDIQKGSIVLFEFEALEKPRTLPRRTSFGATVPIDVERYELEVPEGWEVRWEWNGGSGPPPETSGAVRTWALTQLPPLVSEPGGPAPAEQERWLAINVLPPDGEEVAPMVLEGWKDFSAWYEGMTGRRHEADTAVREVAAGLATGGAGDTPATLEAAGRYVRDKVRYVAVELGIGSLRPRKATETLANLYGDCKDKGTLFRSMLSIGGLETYPLLVNSTYDGTLSERIPAWGFNHFIVGVALPEDLEVPGRFSPAILETEDLGRLLIVDTTDERLSVGSMSAALAGKRALLVAGDRGRLVTLPGDVAAAHRIDRRLDGEVAPTGFLRLEQVTSRTGEFARRSRASFSASSEDYRRGVERSLLSVWPDAVTESFDAVDENEEGAFVDRLTLRFKIRPPAGETRRVEIFPAAGSEIGRVSLSGRETPVVFDHPLRISYETTISSLPEGVEPPRDRDDAGEGWAVRTHYRIEDGVLQASCEILLDRRRFESADFPVLREFWAATSRAGAAALKVPG